jgi:hypothetical protein
LSRSDERIIGIWDRKILTKIFGPVKKKCVCEDPHQSRVDESAQGARYELRNQKNKIKMVRACEKNVRRNNCEGTLGYPLGVRVGTVDGGTALPAGRSWFPFPMG